MRLPGMVLTLLCAGSAGCVVAVDEAGGSGEAGGSTSVASESVTATASTSPAVPEGCGDNLLLDGGFEMGTPNAAWEEASPLFDTPICDASCTEDLGAAPLVGAWWVWFGGALQMDTPSVRQTVVIPPGQALLRFGFSLNAGAGAGSDAFTATLDEDTLLFVTDAQTATFGGWRTIERDVSQWADGEEHTLSFSATLAGAGVTNFFVDEVELLPCESVGATSSGGSTGSSSSGSTGGSAGSTSSGTSSGSSSTSGTSSSSSSTSSG